MTDTDRNTAMAEALGWERHRLKIQDTNYWVAPTGFPTADYCMTTDMLAAYFASPAGEKAVRDKVRELAGHDSVTYFYEPDDELKHTVCVSSNELDFNPWRTESEAWNEALEWLTDKLAERGD